MSYSEIGLELVRVIVTALLAAVLTHWLSHRRFIQGQWWERKKEAYDSIISSIVGLMRWLEWEMEYDMRRWKDPEYKPSEEVLKAVRDKYKEARDRIERAAIEGDYVVTRRTAKALAELVEALKIGPEVVGTDWWGWCDDRYGVAKSYLEVIRGEARSDLRVKWYSW